MTGANPCSEARRDISRPDKATAELIDTAIALVLTDGLAAAERYLQANGIPKRTELRVLTPNLAIRRRSQYR